MKPRTGNYALLAVPVLLVCACTEDTDYTTSILSRPIDFAVTCIASDYSFLDVDNCADSGAVAVSWVLDGDVDGVFVSSLPNGGHIDFDEVLPGYSPVPVGARPVAIEGSPDSRNVFVSISGPAGTEPSLRRISGDFYNLKGVAGSFPLECPPIEMTVIRDPAYAAGYTIAMLLRCAAGDQIWRFTPVAADLESAGDAFVDAQKIADVPGQASWLAAGQGRVLVVSSGLPADTYEKWDYLLSYDGFHAGESTVTAVPVVNDSALAPRYAPAVDATACPAQAAGFLSGYVSGRPAVSPDGEFIYVPISVPSGIAVFDSSLARVDTHALQPGLDTTDSTADGDTWQIANLLGQWNGYKDIRMDSPVMGVSFVQVEDGLRGLAWLYGGQIVRVIVEPDEEFPWAHRAENDLEGIESSAYMPIINYNGQDLERGIVARSDLPWFGNRGVVIPATEEEKYEYYGITFNGDIEAEVPETWYFTYEGVIPRAEGACATMAEVSSGDGLLRSWSITPGDSFDLCALGVEGASPDYPGDIVEVTLPVATECGQFAGRSIELRVTQVTRDALIAVPLSAAGVDITTDAGCLAGAVPFKVRAAGQWVVRGSRTGFLHPWRSATDGTCVIRDGADPIFTGRAPTAMPPVGQMMVDSCPIADGVDTNIDWVATGFRNPMFSLHVIAGCRIGQNYQPVVIPPVRDTVIRFGTETGRIPYQNDIGGLPASISVHGSTLYALDASNGRMLVLDPSDMTISGSWF